MVGGKNVFLDKSRIVVIVMISVAFVVVAHDGNWKKIRGLEMKYVAVIVTPVKFAKYALND